MSSVITGNVGYQQTFPKVGANVAVELNTETGGSETPVVQSKAQSEQVKLPISAEDLGQAVEDINQFVNSQGRTLNFSVDEESGKPVVKVIDFETKEVIRQIPSEEVLTMAKAIKKLQEDLGSATGLMFDKTI